MVVAALACLPPALLAGPGGRADVPFLLAALAIASVGTAGQLVRGRLDARSRELVGIAVLAGAAVLLVALAARSELPAHDLLGHLAALQVTTSAVRRRSARWGVQAGVLFAAAWLLVADADRLALVGLGPAEDSAGGLLDGAVPGGVVGPLLLLAALTALASALAADLERARSRTAETARRVARRAEVLTTVRNVAQAGPRRAFGVVVDGLLDLGFDAAGVALIRGRSVEPALVRGLRWTEVLTTDHPQIRRLLSQDEPLLFADYRSDRDGTPGVDLGAVAMVAVRGDGRPQGVLLVGRREAGALEPDEVESLDVLAAHLGAALVTEQQERRQRERLARLRELERLRSRFVARVTDDLRDPLTLVRASSQVLARRADQLTPERRAEITDRLAATASGLERTIESLLDVSRDADADGEPEIIDVLALLAPALRGGRLEVVGTARGTVVVDVDRVRRALVALRRAEPDPDAPLILREVDEAVEVVVPLGDGRSLAADTARAAAEQLLIAAGVDADFAGDAACVRLPRPARTGGGVR